MRRSRSFPPPPSRCTPSPDASVGKLFPPRPTAFSNTHRLLPILVEEQYALQLCHNESAPTPRLERRRLARRKQHSDVVDLPCDLLPVAASNSFFSPAPSEPPIPRSPSIIIENPLTARYHIFLSWSGQLLPLSAHKTCRQASSNRCHSLPSLLNTNHNTRQNPHLSIPPLHSQFQKVLTWPRDCPPDTPTIVATRHNKAYVLLWPEPRKKDATSVCAVSPHDHQALRCLIIKPAPGSQAARLEHHNSAT